MGSDIVTLGMAVIIGNILGGPTLLKRAIAVPVLSEPQFELDPPQRSAPDDWAEDA